MKTQNANIGKMKAFIALLLSLVMVISLIPASAFTVSAKEVTYLVEETKITAQQKIDISPVCSDNYTVEFTWNYTASDGRFNVLLRSGNSEATAQVKLQFNPSANRIQFYSQGNKAGATNAMNINDLYTGCVVKIVVNANAGTYQLFVDDVPKTHANVDSAYDIPFSGASATEELSNVYISAACNLSDLKVYTETESGEGDGGEAEWIVNQSATLGENIHMNFTGTVDAGTGINKIRASLGSAVVGEYTDFSNGFEIIVPVAAALMNEVITLDALDATGTLVESRTYTVAGYLEQIKNTAGFEEIANHTLNYGAAAAAYFDKTAVSAPADLVLADVPGVQQVGDNLTITGPNTNVTELMYGRGTALTGIFTVQFRYQLGFNESAVFKLGDNVNSTTVDVQLKLLGRNDSRGDLVRVDVSNDVNFNYTCAEETFGQWHTLKVTVNSNTQKYQLWIDGVQVAWDDDKDAQTPAVTEFDCYTGTEVSLKRIAFDADKTRVISIDDFAVYAGEEQVFADSFETFTFVSSFPSTGEVWYVPAENTTCVTLNEKAANPISGACTGVEVMSANLLFEDQIKVRYCLQFDANADISTYDIKIGDTAVADEDIVVSGGKCYIYSNGINPQMYDTDKVLTVTKDGETLTVSYSPMDYITRMSNKDGTTADMKTLLKAMYNYYLVAKAFVETNN